ncbi:calcium-binding protein [Rhizobium sp. KAs_5_22]|uniref:beta strand repeat-containing protein n=1 Tax=Ciceribacter selenitireducens TaxID=448181 RepID=UPI0004B13F67|nr:calcium-binding protein [Ciceribacter selenitireducens]PPJ49266.1 calcium-binding protein [Rhizobium sp. KAs_5_22]
MGRTITGTNGAERIEQGSETEISILALGGNDTIILNRSDDLGGGNFVDAGAGNDSVVNAKEFGNEILLGIGNDTYVGTGFASFASEPGDVVRAGGGNDTIAVTTFKSQYFGESDNDTFISEGWQNFFDGGAGTDTLSYELRDESNTLGGTGVAIDLAQNFTNTGAGRIEEFSSIENATGTNVGDDIFGSSVANVLGGRGGSDLLVGRSGNDTLNGGTGADEMVGGSGNDTYIVDNAGDIVDELNDGGSGTDTVQSAISFSLLQSARVGGVVENLTLLGAGNINATGNDLANLLTGNSGNNVLNGRAGADTMAGLAGNDTYVVDSLSDVVVEALGNGTDTVQTAVSLTLGDNFENLTLLGAGNLNGTGNGLANIMTGNSGNNILNGRGGADTMRGLAGNDTYMVDSVADVVVETVGNGTDTVQAAVNWTLGDNVENLTLLGAGNINGVGNALNNLLTGNSGNNILNGAGGNDTINGGAGIDRLFGNVGNDTLTGGTGADTFVFQSTPNAATNVDTITDFSVADDTISLENSVFTTIGAVGVLAAAAFVRNTTGLAQDASDRIIYETDTGNLFYDSNGNAAGGSVLVAVLDPGLLLTSGDFGII